MALLKTIKDSFVNGWNKNKNEAERLANTGAIDMHSSGPLFLSSHTYIPKEDDYIFTPQVISSAKVNKQDKQNLRSPKNLDITVTPKDRLHQFTNISTSFSNINKYENPFKLSQEVLNSTNNYKFIFNNAVSVLLENGIVDADTKQEIPPGTPVDATFFEVGAVPSLFNPWYAIHVSGIMENNPLLNNPEVSQESLPSKIEPGSNVTFTINGSLEDVSDCSIKKLVELSTPEPGKKFPKLGMSTYKYSDFMYCKDLGKVANNHLITLRRFPYAIGDDIWTDYSSLGAKIPSDVGRLVCYLGDDNKLEDILKYRYSDSWRPLTSEIEQKDSTSENEDRGILGSLVNLGNSTYRNYINNGYGEGQNKVLNWVSGNIKIGNIGIFESRGQYSTGDAKVKLGMYDKHKVYEKQGTIQDTHIYEGKLQFTQEFTIIFDYELRAYENINPKSAFLDLLGNIFAVTYKKGHFWGGEQWLIGTPENKQGWDRATAFVSGKWDKVSDFVGGFLHGDISANDVVGMIGNSVDAIQGAAGNFANSIGKIAGGDFSSLEDLRNRLANTVDKFEIGNTLKSMFMNRIGRPSVYAFSSLLSGSPVGLWHLTIGNPRNPIMAMGNLILVDSTVQHYGPLGIDDFPTGLKVAVTLKHAKSRDAVEISRMYTKGASSIYLNFVNNNEFADYFDISKTNIFNTDDPDVMKFGIASTKGG